MIVTVDGPAGAGKSSVARALAERLGFAFLDTGAMYRAVSLAAVRAEGPWDDPAALADLARQSRIELDGRQVYLNGEDVTEAIRSSEVTSHIHYMADNAEVREHLVRLQRDMAAGRDMVAEGRDQGTVAFPRAECKIFLTATPPERAKRRVLELQQQGEQISIDEVLQQQNERDFRDANRAVGRLVKAEDAVEVITDGLSFEEVLERLISLAREKGAGGDDG